LSRADVSPGGRGELGSPLVGVRASRLIWADAGLEPGAPDAGGGSSVGGCEAVPAASMDGCVWGRGETGPSSMRPRLTTLDEPGRAERANGAAPGGGWPPRNGWVSSGISPRKSQRAAVSVMPGS
jgi:hypothetical protein